MVDDEEKFELDAFGHVAWFRKENAIGELGHRGELRKHKKLGVYLFSSGREWHEGGCS